MKNPYPWATAALARLLDRLQPTESTVTGGAAVIVGLMAGVCVWLFKVAYQGLFALLHTGDWTVTGWPAVFIPAAGALIAVLIMKWLVGAERHHGVAGIMEAVALAGGRLRYWRMPAKATGAALSLGSGCSVGPEDPSVQIGANAGSMLGQVFHLSEARVRVLVAAGAAAGVAAAFNAPIAGVFFAMEIILGELGGNALGLVVLASVTSAVSSQYLSGHEGGELAVPACQFSAGWALPLCIVLGLACGPLSSLYGKLIFWMQSFWKATRLPFWAVAITAGLCVGVVGVNFPEVLGVGYPAIMRGLSGNGFDIWWLPVVLCLCKLVLTPLCIGGGIPGGIFAPSMFIGAMAGSAFGILVNTAWPGIGVPPALFAMAAMAATLAGTVRAPLTAILLLFELTRDYRMVLPLMFCVATAVFTAGWFCKNSFYHASLVRKGIRLLRGRDVDVMETLCVHEVMGTDFPVIPESMSAADALDRLDAVRHRGLPVVDGDGELVGVVTIPDLHRVPAELRAATRVSVSCTRDVVTVLPDDTLATAMRRMGVRDIARLPVVESAHSRRLVGLLRRDVALRAYDAAVVARTQSAHRAQQARLAHLAQVEVLEFTVLDASSCAHKAFGAIKWPDNARVVSFRRGHELHIPHDDTVFLPGDIFAIVIEGDHRGEVDLLFAPVQESGADATPAS